MKRYFAYTRVSTDKQGERGVSLDEQKEIIKRYAFHKGLNISTWFEETETASKVGRPIFNQVLSLLKKGGAAGVVIHKVDRGARNFRDWAEIGELRNIGVEVHFATESLDLNTLSGMLSADLQAVMSVHYSRNLSEEVKKGYYGRLRQGLCPRPAPLGYINNGDGKVKTIDPLQGPIVKEAFELYATGRYSLIQLTEELYKRGLRTRPTRKQPGGERVGRTSVAAMLSNPFYIGVLHVKKENRTFAGVHEPLISKYLFERVQDALTGKAQRKTRIHRFPFSRLITCGICGRSLVGETQKGHVYYRCHSGHAILKEESVDEKFSECFQRLRLSSEDDSLVDLALAEIKDHWQEMIRASRQSEELRLTATRTKLERVTDAFIDGLLDKSVFEQKKTALTLECREIDKRIADIESGDLSSYAKVTKVVELVKAAYPLYEFGNPDEKLRLIKSVMSNRLATHKSFDISLRFPFSRIAERNGGQSGCPSRTGGRTFWQKLIGEIMTSTKSESADGSFLCL